MTIEEFKKKLSLVFDDDTQTVVWKNYVDYAIWTIIIISTIAIFLSTYNDIAEKYGSVLKVIDIITTIIFTIEVSLRIWTIDILEPKYSGFWGRVKYCLSFYGFIDFISTYSYYINFFFPLPLMALKAIRVARLLRIFRFMKSFRLLTTAIGNKSKELLVSLQFLVVITIILSFILFFAEHDAQPDVYDNGMTPVLWAFMQYIGDPGGFGDYPPVTIIGRIIACIIGILGIAIFAVPAGLIGAGFTEAMEDDEKSIKTKENIEKLHLAFERKLDRYTRFQTAPQIVSVADIQARLRMSLDDVFDAINNSNKFRLVNLASTRTVDERADDKLAVEHFPLNRDYGYAIDRGSNVTIVSPSSYVDAGFYHFAYYLAKISGFNYVSREIGVTRPYKSFYLPPEEIKETSDFKSYMHDLNELTKKEGHWVITLLVASGANEPAYPEQVHFCYGGKKGDETYDDPNLTIHDIPLFETMYQEMQERLAADFNIKCDKQRYHDSANSKIYTRHLDNADKINSIFVRVAWSECLWNPAHVQISQVMGQIFNKYFDGDKDISVNPDMKKKAIGYDGYDE